MGNKVFTFGDIRIREVKGKYYVYLIEKDNEGNRRDNYIGKLDEVVKFYTKNAKTGVVGALPPQGSGPWDQGSNPCPATSLSPLSNNELNVVITNEPEITGDKKTEKLPSKMELFAFYNDCVKKVSRETCKEYVNYLRKPLDVNNKASILAWKKYYKWKGDIEKWKAIKTKKSGVDLKVPSVDQIKQWAEKVKGSRVELLFKLLLESGIRFTEAIKVLNEYSAENDVCENNICIYTLNWQRGSKRVFYVFHISKLEKQNITYNYAKKLFHELDIAPKYIRKFTATKMLELGIPSEVVDFLEGRTPGNILTKHYLDLLTLAKKYYPLYAEWLRQNI
ncbi:integrase [Sulfolobus spindle-shaped virus 5]|uniref:Integrase n=1 Tax=Sulfolobus spindle-shaped virus 5 TaxID=459291 RepID=B5KLF8_9VIRU|nr:integrase [Sulfolobus spindle-shaped virus 5]ABV26234.1 integrase [Sulfolobus spindle-shaped virus 5]